MEGKIISLLNSAAMKPGTGEIKKFAGQNEPALDFAQLLEEQKKTLEDPAKGQNKEMVTEEPSKNARGKEDQKGAEALAQKSINDWQKELLPLLRYIQLLAKRHPDTLSPTEKQILNLNEKDLAGGVLKDLPKLLAEKGLKLSSFTQGEMARLLENKNPKELNAFLEQLLREGKNDKGREFTAAQMLIEEKAGLKTSKGQTREDQEIANQLNREEVIRQIVDKLEVRNLERGTKAVLRLNPEFLGDLKVELLIQPDKVTARFQTTSPEVKNLLLEGREELTAALEQKGLKLDGLNAELVEEIS